MCFSHRWNAKLAGLLNEFTRRFGRCHFDFPGEDGLLIDIKELVLITSPVARDFAGRLCADVRIEPDPQPEFSEAVSSKQGCLRFFEGDFDGLDGWAIRVDDRCGSGGRFAKHS